MPRKRKAASKEGRVGPNAALQLAAVLRHFDGDDEGFRLFERAGQGRLWRKPPSEMMDEAAAAALFRAVGAHWDAASAQTRLREAGRRTGAYVAQNRVPRAVRAALRAAPAFVAGSILLRAIRANAWTFAGSGACETATSPVWRVDIYDNPLATPRCPWHAGVFEALFEGAAGARVDVVNSRCCALGDDTCSFEIRRAEAARSRAAQSNRQTVS